MLGGDVHELDCVCVDGLQSLRHFKFAALVIWKFVDAVKQRLQSAEGACIALNYHIQLVAVILTLEQRLLVPNARVSMQQVTQGT